MDLIQEAIAEIESRELGDKFSYQAIAKKHGVARMTLMRRHRGETEAYGVRNLSLHPQHEKELVRYIDTLTKRQSQFQKARLTSSSASTPTISSLPTARG
ncbi:uncharacterized protein SETTUDRAFT_24157 [Exserohilum turcica Et28A]|uniref:HTH psq-type domain-containing protein n=1 Tax=Exserohilum turcicum (strain 28A) TaxID=671987 RepID=R0JW96_EXST2|nr:uncharacterized protein SETTUDRAFT_24157 [Exserohilum turcica Et28A]EOA81764.1 hypothetical protein SETTUDRAFT_24157 [Exserohilum turcica Et28A]